MIFVKLNKTIKNDSSLFIIIAILIYVILVAFFFKTGFFWDSISIISKPANYLYDNGLSSIIHNRNFDNGDPQIVQILLVLFWKIFKRSIFFTHLFFSIISVAVLYQLYKLSHVFFDSKVAKYVFVLLSFDPAFLTQITGMYQDAFLILFSIMSLNFYFLDKKWLLALSLLFLSMTSRRGMLTCFSFMLAILVIEIFQNKKNVKQFINQFLILFMPAILFVFLYVWWRLKYYGWFFTTNTTDSGELIESWNALAKNIAVFFRYMFDNGRILLWIMGAFIAFRKKKYIINLFNENKKIIIFYICILIVMLSVTLPIKNAFGSRYFIVQYLILLLLFSKLIITYIPFQKVRYYFIAAYIALITGNFWIYPETFSKSWDSSLAHYSYFDLRKNCFDYIDANNICYDQISSGFCLYGNRGFVELENYDKNVNSDLTRKYFIYSNISNLPDNEFIELTQSGKWKNIKEFKRFFVKITLYQRQ